MFYSYTFYKKNKYSYPAKPVCLYQVSLEIHGYNDKIVNKSFDFTMSVSNLGFNRKLTFPNMGENTFN